MTQASRRDARLLRNSADAGLRWVSPKLTKAVATGWGSRLGCWFVSEHPKSGGTWVARMLADYLRLPFPQRSRLPVMRAAIVHNHWAHHPRRVPTLYVYRDGRDVMVSLYFHLLRRINAGASPLDAMLRRQYEGILGPEFCPDEIRRRLPVFIRHELTDPHGTTRPWHEHTTSWVLSAKDAACVSYESLLADATAVLRSALEGFGLRVDVDRLASTVERHSFQQQSGRPPGTEDRSSFLRKGVAGDWRNHFTREAAESFNQLAGRALMSLGYEPDDGWVQTCADV